MTGMIYPPSRWRSIDEAPLRQAPADRSGSMELAADEAVWAATTRSPDPRLAMRGATNAMTMIGGLLVACGLLAAGCGLIAVHDPTFANAPVAVRDRAPLPACGVETVRADADANVAGRHCLWAAYQEHRPAEFVTTRWSIEGDPITWIYRILPGGGVEVFIDSTHDAWSAKTWLQLACPGLSLVDEAQVQLDFGPGLGAGGECTETTIR